MIFWASHLVNASQQKEIGFELGSPIIKNSNFQVPLFDCRLVIKVFSFFFLCVYTFFKLEQYNLIKWLDSLKYLILRYFGLAIWPLSLRTKLIIDLQKGPQNLEWLSNWFAHLMLKLLSLGIFFSCGLNIPFRVSTESIYLFFFFPSPFLLLWHKQLKYLKKKILGEFYNVFDLEILGSQTSNSF